MSDAQPKKQFKSQSVNSLFRQQVTSKAFDTSKDVRKSRSPTPTTTKLKLVTRRKGPILKKYSPTPCSETPMSADSSRSSDTMPPSSSETDKQYSISPTTETPLENSHSFDVDAVQSCTTSLIHAVIQTPSAQASHQKYDFAEDEWSDIQSQISTQTNSPHHATRFGAIAYSERLAQYSPEGARSWSSPNSKISSFRRSVATPMIHSLSQSPLSKPVDSPFISEQTLNSGYFAGERNPSRLSESRSNTVSVGHLDEQSLWKSPTIWNTEDRHLSTKSDSAVGGSWAQYDMENLSLDDSVKVQPPTSFSSISMDGLSSQNVSKTSRFFPSPVVDQNPSFDQYPRQPSLVERPAGMFQAVPPHFNLFPSPVPPQNDYGFQGRQLFQDTQPQTPLDPISNFTESSSIPPPPPPQIQQLQQLQQSQYQGPSVQRTLETSTQKMDHEIFPQSFYSDPTQTPVSLYQPYNTDQSTHQYYKRSVSYDQQPYPEGFSSTFYKRGNNNFMFIRELQPKLVTSKNRDTVEVRVSFPSTAKIDDDDDDDSMIKMRCHIVNVDVKELEGRIAGIKVAKSGSGSGRSGRSFGGRGHFRGHGRRN